MVELKKCWPALLLVMMIALSVAGCASTRETSEETKVQVVSERAKAMWQHLLKGDFHAAYGYLSPAYRSAVSEERYRSTFKAGLWKGAEVKSVNCSAADVCQVDTEIEYQYVGKRAVSVGGKRVVVETWRRDAVEWWNVPDLR